MRQRPGLAEIALGAALGIGVFLGLQGYNVLPAFALAGLFFLFSQVPGLRAPTRARAAAGPGAIPRVDFDEIGGQETAKKELKEALDFVVQRDRIRQLGIRPLKGILLTGPPGTGKTLLAKAAASYTDSVFLAASGSEFVEMYAGVGASRVRDLFRRAREMARHAGKASAIIFLDELEVLGGRRGAHQSHLEYDQTLNQLLVEMDGIQTDADVQIVVVGATNRPDLLDPALLRPGRFDRIVQVDLPDLKGRLAILEIHVRQKPLGPDVDLEQIARQTFGFSGAQLESLTNEAAILALREGAEAIEQRHLVEAIDKVILGEKVDRRPTPEEKRRVAVHEAGHAVVAEWVEPGSVASVTITPRGRAMGYVRSHPENDRYLYTREMLEGQIRVALAGAIAEDVVFGSRSTGAQSDFEKVVHLARQIVESGLSEMGVVDMESADRARVNEVISKVVQEQEEAVRAYLQQHRAVLGGVAEILEDRESMEGDELRRILARPSLAAVAGTEG
ncbi:AAA family ATPase [Caldinitratiruptor microaerophilus]|uniref:Vesicle-fusing ATPase n=1 Tax=Caldinitratiruptor microaerophilus TaxID=671077 RepID=A0AA35CLC7_9FIRM|nr:AAA family ATPase [Caldinitratiruptor microaerophilus]BDG60533.1 vesicle-fusing ATPase [Caldinitratiruptor microaerophilus]